MPLNLSFIITDVFFDQEKETNIRNEFPLQQISLFDSIFDNCSQINFEQNFFNSESNSTMNTPPMDNASLNENDSLFHLGYSIVAPSGEEQEQEKKDEAH